jgi:hypothetical protein
MSDVVSTLAVDEKFKGLGGGKGDQSIDLDAVMELASRQPGDQAAQPCVDAGDQGQGERHPL